MGSRLGQHFLIRESILERIAQAACPEPEPLVVEIGPGKGALTSHLLGRAERVIAIEVDSYLTHYLQQKFRAAENLTIVESDILKADLDQWGDLVIAGNLPYYITSPILSKVFSLGPRWKRAVFLVQKEVAERITAKSGSRDYGFLSVHAELFAEREMLFTVAPGAFRPPPKVDSAVVRLTRRDPEPENARVLLEFIGRCFEHKRKMLRNNLRDRYSRIDEMPEAGKRAEQLTLNDFISLFHRLTA